MTATNSEIYAVFKREIPPLALKLCQLELKREPTEEELRVATKSMEHGVALCAQVVEQLIK